MLLCLVEIYKIRKGAMDEPPYLFYLFQVILY